MPKEKFDMFLLKDRMKKEILRINNQYDYNDTKPPNGRDLNLVSFGQKKDYNELWEIAKHKLIPYIIKGVIKEKDAITALNECCKERKGKYKRDDFYKSLTDKLNVPITRTEPEGIPDVD